MQILDHLKTLKEHVCMGLKMSPRRCRKPCRCYLENTKKFLKPPKDQNTKNGLVLNGVHLPEEILTLILSYVEPVNLLEPSRVCRTWCRIIRTMPLWSLIYERHHKKQPPNVNLPWYTYYSLFTSDKFDRNLLKNGNGQDNFEHWTIIKWGGEVFKVESPPEGADPLPENVPEFNGHTSCFATSYDIGKKRQVIDFSSDRLFTYIVKMHHPHVYVSEWVSGRFGSTCTYTMITRLCLFDFVVHEEGVHYVMNRRRVPKWVKKEIIIHDYWDEFTQIVFVHLGQDSFYLPGHCGSKMAGGVVKFLFDTMQEKVKSMR